MDLLGGRLEEYVDEHTTPENEVLAELNRQTHLRANMPQMLSGHLQGQLLRMFSRMVNPKNILEIGTYTGYSAICLADGLRQGGKIDTIDNNEELEEIIIQYIQKAGLEDLINLHIGEALEIIPRLTSTYDLVFIDADKVNYSNYYKAIFEKVSPGGFIIADNVLWSGKVVEEDRDEDTQALVNFNAMVKEDNRVENVLLPVRDGLMVVYKKK